MASKAPTRPATPKDEDTERVVRERIANMDEEPDEDAGEALDDIVRRNVKHPAPR